MKQLMALALVLLLPVLTFAHDNDGDGVADVATTTTSKTNDEVLSSVLNRLATLEATLLAAQAKLGVAVVSVEAADSTRDLDGASNFLVNPKYYIQGSTIEGFHENAPYNAEITDSNPADASAITTRGVRPADHPNAQGRGVAYDSRELPLGTYLFELEQPWPAIDDAGCASDTWGFDCEPMRFVVSGTTAQSRGRGGGNSARKVFRHAGIIKIDGINYSHFFVAFHVRKTLVTASRPKSSFKGKVKITKLK